MKTLIVLILFPFLIIPFGTKASENSVEIEALTLVMDQYKEDAKSNLSLDSISSLYCSITSVRASISTVKLSFAFVPNGMTRNGNKTKAINFFISIKSVYFFYNVDCLLKEGVLAVSILLFIFTFKK